MALNDAIQAVLVYHNIDRAKDRKAELWAYNTVKTKLVLRDVVPSVPLATFIVYWPHYKRFHEVQKMSRYMHPFRFAHSNYALDCKVFGSRAEIDSSHIDSKRVFELVDNLKSLEPDIPANHFIPVLPHSMPGSKLIWPKGTGAAQKETTALAGLLLLNDINLCGLPSYHHPESNAAYCDACMFRQYDCQIPRFRLHLRPLYPDSKLLEARCETRLGVYLRGGNLSWSVLPEHFTLHDPSRPRPLSRPRAIQPPDSSALAYVPQHSKSPQNSYRENHRGSKVWFDYMGWNAERSCYRC